MWDCDIGSVPVIDEAERVVGMITDRDICMAAYTRDQRLAEISVDQAMSRKVFSCRPDEDIEIAERLMQKEQIRRLPVTDYNQRLVGVVSLNDIVREAARQRHQRLPQVAEGEVVATMAAIGAPRSTSVAATH
jgi:CBS domain-containing protein